MGEGDDLGAKGQKTAAKLHHDFQTFPSPLGGERARVTGNFAGNELSLLFLKIPPKF